MLDNWNCSKGGGGLLEVEGRQFYSVKDIAAMKNRGREATRKLLIKNNLQPVFIKKINNHKTGFYTQEQADLIPYLEHKRNTTQRHFFRISQYDEITGLWIVIACGLGTEKARKTVKELRAKGLQVVATEHKNRFHEPKQKRG